MLLVAALLLLPLALYAAPLALRPVQLWSAALPDSAEALRLAALLGRTVLIAALAATLAAGFAALAFAAAGPLPGWRRRLAWALLLAPLLAPGHFLAIAWIQTVGRAGWLTALLGSPFSAWLPAALYSPAGCAALLGLRLYAVALLLLVVGWRGVEPPMVESMAPRMRPGPLLAALLTGWLRPWLVAGWLLVFVMALLEYSIPALVRQTTFAVEAMTAYHIYYNADRALALAVPLLVPALLALLAVGRLALRRPWPAGMVGGSRRAPVPRPRGPVGVLLAVGAVLLWSAALGLPLLTLLRMAGGPASYARVLASGGGQMLSSLLWAGAAAVLCALLGAALAWRNALRGARPQPVTAAAMIALFATPPAIVAMALIAFWNRPGEGPPARAMQAVFDSGWMLVLGLLAVHLPLAWVLLRARVRSMPPLPAAQARLRPPLFRERLTRVALPLMLRPAAQAAAVVLVLAMHEVQTSMLLAAPGQETVAVRAMTLLHYAPDSLVAAFCLCAAATMALGAGTLALTWLALDKLLRKAVPDLELA